MADLKRTQINGDLIVKGGECSRIVENVDATLADNGVSSKIYPTTFNILDKNQRILNRLETILEDEGVITSYWYVRNYDTNGNQVAQKGISMSVNKAGSLSYKVDDATNFRSALGLGAASTRGVKSLSAIEHSGWGTNNNYVPDMSFIVYWNGAYNSGGASNLAYCRHGAFGNVCTLEYEQVDSW